MRAKLFWGDVACDFGLVAWLQILCFTNNGVLQENMGRRKEPRKEITGARPKKNTRARQQATNQGGDMGGSRGI